MIALFSTLALVLVGVLVVLYLADSENDVLVTLALLITAVISVVALVAMS